MAKEKPQMCKKFQEIFEKFRPGVDFLIFNEKEKNVELDKYDQPKEGTEWTAELDFDEYAKNIEQSDVNQRDQGYSWDYNSGCYAAFDYATKTYICTARPDVINYENAADCCRGLFVALRRDMRQGPADPGKLAAYKYQESVADMLDAEKKALKANSSLLNLLTGGKGKEEVSTKKTRDY